MAQTQMTRSVMTGNVEVAKPNESVLDAAKKLTQDNIGAMPICDTDGSLKGMITDRDIVTKVVAQGKDPAKTTVGELAEGKPVTIDANAPVDEAMKKMAENQVRRLPVIDNGKLVGMVSQADLAKALPGDKAGKMVEQISK
jgi:CBS domain-containing protein